jgi:hypothetical protein
MESFDELLQKAEVVHGHMCAGQILGVRMALLGLKRLGIEDPRGADRKRLVTYIEIDRCATDAIGMVTGCRLGKRSLKFRDWGKMAATFIDLATNRGVRIAALEDSRELARKLYPHIESKSAQQMAAYRALDCVSAVQGRSGAIGRQSNSLNGKSQRLLICFEKFQTTHSMKTTAKPAGNAAGASTKRAHLLCRQARGRARQP